MRETSTAADNLTDFMERQFQSPNLSTSAFLSHGKQSHFQNNCNFRMEEINNVYFHLPSFLFTVSSAHGH